LFHGDERLTVATQHYLPAQGNKMLSWVSGATNFAQITAPFSTGAPWLCNPLICNDPSGFGLDFSLA